MTCGRCKRSVPWNADACWLCLGKLCDRCWEEFGQCGHPQDEAEILLDAKDARP